MGRIWLRRSGQLLLEVVLLVKLLTCIRPPGDSETCLQDQIRFSLHVQDGLVDVVEDYLETDKKDMRTGVDRKHVLVRTAVQLAGDKLRAPKLHRKVKLFNMLDDEHRLHRS